MSDLSNNEQRLTAFFDGELSGDERAAVERLLAGNPEYRKLLDSWKQSGDRLRALPRYRLGKSFTSQVMQKIAVTENQVTVPPPTLASHWRIGFAAIATLAAMLLLTLFVFPNLNNSRPLAFNNRNEAQDTVSPTAAGLISKGGPAADVAPEKSDKSSLAENVNLTDSHAFKKPGAMKMEESVSESGDESLKKLDQTQIADMEFDSPIPRPKGILSRSGEDYRGARPDVALAESSNAPSSGSQKTQSDESTNEGFGMGGVGQQLGGFSGTPAQPPAPSDQPAVPSLAFGNSQADRSRFVNGESNDSAALEQVLMIDMSHESQPLAVVNEVLFRNQIEVVTSGKDMKRANQAQIDMEAIYVVSTTSQMQQAILELSDQANISGYQIPSVQMLASQAVPQQSAAQELQVERGLSADEVAAADRQADLFGGQLLPQDSNMDLVQGKESESPFEGSQFRDAKPTDLRPQPMIASAQQLQPYNLGVNQANPRFSAKSSYQAEEGQAFFSNQSVAELKKGKNSAQDLPADTELIRYLLFVRTSATALSDADKESFLESGNANEAGH